MAQAMKCDRCNILYEKYNHEETNSGKSNGVRLYRRTNSNLYNGECLDLCESCMKSFDNWFGIEIKHTDH